MAGGQRHPVAERHRRSERGAVVPLVGILLVVVILGAAFAVDIGRTTVSASEVRTIADLTALDAARSLTGQPASAQYPVVTAAARSAATRNGYPSGSALTVELGTAVALGGADVGRYSFTPIPVNSSSVPNAVRVRAQEDVRFSLTEGGTTPTRSATAFVSSGVGTVTIRLDSGLARIDTAESPLLDPLLGQMLGTAVNLSLANYRLIADANVSLLGVINNLGTRIGSTDVNEILGTVYSASDIIGAIASQLTNSPALPVLNGLPLTVGSVPVTPGDVIGGFDPGSVDLPGYSDVPLEGLMVDALDLLVAFAMSSAVGATMNLGTGLNVPGIADLVVTGQLIQPPKITSGLVGTTVQTAQIALRINQRLLDGGLVVPLFVDVAPATATVSAIDCSDGVIPRSVTVDARTSAARLGIGTLVNGIVQKATVVNLNLGALGGLVDVLGNLLGNLLGAIFGPPPPPSNTGIRINARADVSVSSTQQMLTFYRALSGVPPTMGYAGQQQTVSPSAQSALLGVGDITIDIDGSGALGSIVNDVLGAARTLVNRAVSPLLSGILYPVLDLLGVRLGVADVGVLEATCSAGPPRLVLVQ